jgi:hypothetical protein
VGNINDPATTTGRITPAAIATTVSGVASSAVRTDEDVGLAKTVLLTAPSHPSHTHNSPEAPRAVLL